MRDEDILAALVASAIHDFDHPGINNSFHVRAQTYLATLYNDRSVLENRHVSAVFELMKLPKFNLLSSVTEDQRRDIRDTIVEMVLATDMGLHGKFVSQWKRRIAENHNLEKKDDMRLALAMALKMADISNCGRPHDIYMRWGAKISDEFYMQGDREKNFGLSISPFMDRAQPGVSKSQISFMNFVVVPMFESISEFLPDMHFSVDHTEQNKSYWMEHQEL
jgi:3',5'-cyclic-nucleotide phosphodiesterase